MRTPTKIKYIHYFTPHLTEECHFNATLIKSNAHPQHPSTSCPRHPGQTQLKMMPLPSKGSAHLKFTLWWVWVYSLKLALPAPFPCASEPQKEKHTSNTSNHHQYSNIHFQVPGSVEVTVSSHDPLPNMWWFRWVLISESWWLQKAASWTTSSII